MGLEYISQPQFFTAPIGAVRAEITTLSGVDAYILNLSAENVLNYNLSAINAKINDLNADDIDTTNIWGVNGYFVNLTAENVKVVNITAENVKVINLTGNSIETEEFDTVNAYIVNLSGQYFEINETQINTLTGGDVTANNLTALNITTNNLLATKYFLIPETVTLEALSSIELPTSSDIELSSSSVVTIIEFLSAVKGVTYTLTNVGSYTLSVSSSPTVFVRNGTTWRSNTASLSTAFLELPTYASCCVRGGEGFVSVW